MEYTILTCCDCNGEFQLKDGEKVFYESKGFQLPKRCRDCRLAKRAKRGDTNVQY